MMKDKSNGRPSEVKTFAEENTCLRISTGLSPGLKTTQKG